MKFSSIQQIYNHYQIPPNLQRHMLEVTAVGRYICDHWSGPSVDKELITKALFLHDMGNIIKFKRPFLGELEPDAAHWEQVQAEFVQKYGSDVHTATMTIITELGKEKEIGWILENMRLVTKQSGADDSDVVKICEYADCCVSPEGIVGFERRLLDLIERYQKKNTEWIGIMRSIADYIQANVTIDLTTLSSHCTLLFSPQNVQK